MPVPFIDLRRQTIQLKEEVLKKLGEVMDFTAFSSGKYVEEFEEAFADYLGVKHVVAVNSGTSALHLIMRALDIGPGDEVIIPSWTFIATAWAPLYVGAKPVFADIDPETWQIDPNDVERKITPRTKAIIGVHIYGQTFDIDTLSEIARRHGIHLIEDAAQAHGALYRGRKTGTFGVANAFSFYPTKNLGSMGEGGAVATNDEKIAERIKLLRNHASPRRYEHVELGYNMRMTGFQGAVLSVKLPHLNKWNGRRQEIANRYREGIVNPLIEFQKEYPDTRGVYHIFAVRVQKGRDDFVKYLREKGIGTGIYYPIPVHLQKPFREMGWREGDLPVTEALSRSIAALPMFPELMDDEVKEVIDVVNEFND